MKNRTHDPNAVAQANAINSREKSPAASVVTQSTSGTGARSSPAATVADKDAKDTN